MPLLYLYLLTQTRSLISLFTLTGSVSILPPEDAISPLSNVYRVSVVNKHLQIKQKTARVSSLQSNTDSVLSAYLSVAGAVNAAIHDVSIDH